MTKRLLTIFTSQPKRDMPPVRIGWVLCTNGEKGRAKMTNRQFSGTRKRQNKGTVMPNTGWQTCITMEKVYRKTINKPITGTIKQPARVKKSRNTNSGTFIIPEKVFLKIYKRLFSGIQKLLTKVWLLPRIYLVYFTTMARESPETLQLPLVGIRKRQKTDTHGDNTIWGTNIILEKVSKRITARP